MTLYPLTFHPLFKTRPWGGRMIESLYGKPLPPDARIGESWEISDRPDDESIVANGPLAGTSLRQLMEQHGDAILGGARAAAGSRFPLLCKILDARDRLSLQVHPPGHRAPELGGEPKTEMWYIADAAPGAELFAGLRPGVTRPVFEAKIASGEVADCFHRIPVTRGDTMFLPSGRVHAIGAGLVIFEIQQNSDTTYRVFDWNRPGLDGKLRELHVPQSLASIDFADVEPALARPAVVEDGNTMARESIVRHGLFNADIWHARAASSRKLDEHQLRVAAVVTGKARASGGGVALEMTAGLFCLIPAATTDATLTLDAGTTVLLIEAGR